MLPSQTGPLLAGPGVKGVAFTTTFTVAGALVHPFTVAVTLYVPDIAVVEDGIVGFCVVELNEFGPVQV